MTVSRKWLIWAAAGLTLAALLVWAFAPRPVAVEFATASVGTFELAISEDGKTRVRDRYVVSAPLAGRLARIALRAGDAVSEGMSLASLAPALAPMRDERTLAELSARVETADAMVARSSQRIERARVAVAQARAERQRTEKLAREGFVSPAKMESDRLAADAAEADLAGASEEHHVARHELAQARAALMMVKQASTAFATAFTLRAPVGGRVLRVLQSSEGTIALGTPLLEIGDVQKMEVVAELLTSDALRARAGAPVRIERWGGPTALAGRVRRVEPAAFTKISALGVEEQRVNVIIDIVSPHEQWQALGDGYRVSVRVVLLAEDNVLRVPVSAVFPLPGDSQAESGMAVFRAVGGRAQFARVEVGARNGEVAWIKSGLNAGDQVIIYPGETVRDGVRVEARATVPR